MSTRLGVAPLDGDEVAEPDLDRQHEVCEDEKRKPAHGFKDEGRRMNVETWTTATRAKPRHAALDLGAYWFSFDSTITSRRRSKFSVGAISISAISFPRIAHFAHHADLMVLHLFPAWRRVVKHDPIALGEPGGFDVGHRHVSADHSAVADAFDDARTQQALKRRRLAGAVSRAGGGVEAAEVRLHARLRIGHQPHRGPAAPDNQRSDHFLVVQHRHAVAQADPA